MRVSNDNDSSNNSCDRASDESSSDKETSAEDEDEEVLDKASHDQKVAKLAKQNADRKKRIVQLNAWTTSANSPVASKANSTGVKTRKKGGSGGGGDLSDDYDGDVSCAIDLNSTSKVSVKSSELKRTTSLPKRTSRYLCFLLH